MGLLMGKRCLLRLGLSGGRVEGRCLGLIDVTRYIITLLRLLEMGKTFYQLLSWVSATLDQRRHALSGSFGQVFIIVYTMVLLLPST